MVNVAAVVAQAVSIRRARPFIRTEAASGPEFSLTARLSTGVRTGNHATCLCGRRSVNHHESAGNAD